MTEALSVLRIVVIDNLLWDATVPIQHLIEVAGALRRLDYLAYSPHKKGLPARRLSDNSAVYPSHSRSRLHFPRDAYRLASALHAQHPYDLIWTDDPMGAGLAGYLLKHKLGVPLLTKVHSDYYSNLAWRSENPRYWLDYVLSLWILRQADGVQTVSNALADQLARLGVPRDKITVLPTLMRRDTFPPGPDTLERYGAGRLLFAGRLVRQKRVDVLIRALRLLVDRGYRPELTVAGRGPLQPRLERLAARLGVRDRVTFAGHLPLPELARLYQQSSVFVLPSGQEAFGKVLAEAALSGLPIVASRVSGIPELVADGENGYLVPPGRPRALADSLARLLDDPALAQRMGLASRRFVAGRWEYGAFKAAYLDMFARVARIGASQTGS